MNCELILPTLHFSRWQENKASWGDVPIIEVFDVRPLTSAYQAGFMQSSGDILGFVHDDVTCFDPDWQKRVLHEFEDPTVGLVGFGGSTGHGNAAIYQIPYEWHQVGREGQFMSNMVNAEQHGCRMTDAAEACCLDGFAMFVRREVLERSQFYGWPKEVPICYWGYDYWLSCEARRQGLKIVVVGVSCEHTCPAEYRSYVVDEDCQEAHKWLYENYRDTFPARIMP